MQTQNLKRLSGLIALLAIAGTATLVHAAEPPDRMDPGRTKPASARAASDRGIVFVSGSKIKGKTVENSEKQSLGSIDDMIIDRGSGRIQYLVLKSGAILGLGGRLVTVPYRSFGWDNVDEHVTLMATPEEIKAWPEFDKKRWMEGARADDSFIRIIGRDYYDSAHSPWPLEASADRAPAPIKGTIKGITRHTVENGQEELVVIVAAPDTPDREIVLGPSWYMTGNNSIAFFRAAPIEADVFMIDRHGHAVVIARTATINGKEMVFYDTKGRAVWSPNSSASDRDAFSAAPFVLFTEIKGKPVDCRGEKCGSVDNVVIECESGRAAFLSIDPDKALLGIGDEDRLVPWTVMTRSLDGTVHLDASKNMVTSAPTSPKDLRTLADGNFYKKIYGVYDVAPVRFDGPRR